MTTHLVGEGTFVCCGRTPWEVPRTDRMTLRAERATCLDEQRRQQMSDYLRLGSEPRYLENRGE